MLLERFNALIRLNFPVNMRTSFRNEITHEYIYEINTDAAKMAERISRKEIALCTFDDIEADSGSYISSDTLIRFAKAYLQSPDISFSGRFSMKLNRENPYGADTRIVSKRGYYRITVMRHSDDGHGLIVASASDGGAFYKTSMGAIPVSGGWEKLELTIDVPEKNDGQEFAIYLWYPGNGKCYFDDLEIAGYEVK
jgi:hypothetical protein